MSFPRYPKYKDSGAEWLGEVPQHWSAGRLRRFARRYSGGTPDKANPGYWQDGVIPWLNSGAVNARLISEPSTFITAEAFANSSAKWVPRGALVMALAGQGKTKGMVAQLAIPSTCNQSMAAIVPNPNVDARFLFWWLDSNYQSIRNLAGGDLRDGLNLELVGNIPLPVLPLPEQTAIAEFLDRETEKIDELVAEQQRLIELLKEKRQAVISHAVTKGLNSHAPMKSSGIDWLGDVPKHWHLHRIKHQFKTCSGSTPSTGQQGLYYTDSEVGIPWVRTTDLPNDKLRSAEVFITERALSDTACSILPIGSVLVAMYGGDGTIGKNGLLEIPAAINQAVCGILPSVQFNPEYVFRYIQFYRPYWMVGAESSRCDPNISQERVRNTPFLKPPLEEQVEIVSFLNRSLTKFDALTAEAQRAIDLLRERRTALISAAVSGQIDVRRSSKY